MPPMPPCSLLLRLFRRKGQRKRSRHVIRRSVVRGRRPFVSCPQGGVANRLAVALRRRAPAHTELQSSGRGWVSLALAYLATAGTRTASKISCSVRDASAGWRKEAVISRRKGCAGHARGDSRSRSSAPCCRPLLARSKSPRWLSRRPFVPASLRSERLKWSLPVGRGRPAQVSCCFRLRRGGVGRESIDRPVK
jgi:hypothetical protein